MEKRIFYSLFESANILLLITFFFIINSLRFKKSSFRSLVIYISIALIAYTISDLIRFGFLKFDGLLIMLLFGFLHYLLLGLFIIKNLIVKLQRVSVFYFISLPLLLIALVYDCKYNSYYSASIANIFLIILCTSYYQNIFNNSIDIDLKSNPSFLIVNGIFLSTSLTIPIILFGQYLKSVLSLEKYYLIASIGPISSIILYCFIIKATRCLK